MKTTKNIILIFNNKLNTIKFMNTYINVKTMNIIEFSCSNLL